jgi:hypothetical protein
MPSRDWRLNAVARDATNGAVLADLATLVLHDNGARDVVNSAALSAIAVAADIIREDGGRAAS